MQYLYKGIVRHVDYSTSWLAYGHRASEPVLARDRRRDGQDENTMAPLQGISRLKARL